MLRNPLNILILLIITFLSGSIIATEGIGYFFRNKNVQKKFYLSEVQSFVFPPSAYVQQTNIISLLREEYLSAVSPALGMTHQLILDPRRGDENTLEYTIAVEEDEINLLSDRLDNRYNSPALSNIETPPELENILQHIQSQRLTVSREYIHHPRIESFQATTYKVQCFVEDIENYSQGYTFDIIFDPPVSLPSWTKSAEFWVKGIDEHLQLIAYMRLADGIKSRYVFNFASIEHWDKCIMNFTNTNREGSNTLDLQLVKLRIHRLPTGNLVDKDFHVQFSNLFANNYLRNSFNRYQPTNLIYEDFEENENQLPPWTCTQNLEQRDCSEFFSVSQHPTPFLENNERYLMIEASQARQSIIVDTGELSQPFYKDYWISILVHGFGGGEEISFIFEEGQGRFFEQVVGKVDFMGWRLLMAKLPQNQFNFYYGDTSHIEYVNLLGIKIAPGYSLNSAIHLGLDNIQGLWIEESSRVFD